MEPQTFDLVPAVKTGMKDDDILIFEDTAKMKGGFCDLHEHSADSCLVFYNEQKQLSHGALDVRACRHVVNAPNF